MRRNNHTVSTLPISRTSCSSSSNFGESASTISSSKSEDDSVSYKTSIGVRNKGGRRYLVRLPTCWTLNVLLTVIVSIGLLFSSTVRQNNREKRINKTSNGRIGEPLINENDGNNHLGIDGASEEKQQPTSATTPQHKEPQRETELSLLSEFGFPPTSRHTKQEDDPFASKTLVTRNENDKESDTSTALSTTSSSYDETTAIVVISMGDMATSTNLVERCLRSIRTRGKYLGRFVILTDHPERYESLRVSQEGITILKAKSSDVNVHIEGGVKLSVVMRYKRFKTLLLDYIDEEPELDHVRRVVYMDYDIVVGRDLTLFWSDVDDLIQKEEASTITNKNRLESSSYMYFFKEDWNKRRREPFHAGVMILDREHSGICLDVWRHEIDTGHVNRDQQGLKLLNDRIQNGLEQHCEMRYIEPRDTHLLFPTSDSMRRNEYATFIHVTNTKRAKMIDSSIQKEFYTTLLHLDGESDESLSDVHTVPKWKTQARRSKAMVQNKAKESTDTASTMKESITIPRVSPDTQKIVQDRVASLMSNQQQ